MCAEHGRHQGTRRATVPTSLPLQVRCDSYWLGRGTGQACQQPGFLLPLYTARPSSLQILIQSISPGQNNRAANTDRLSLFRNKSLVTHTRPELAVQGTSPHAAASLARGWVLRTPWPPWPACSDSHGVARAGNSRGEVGRSGAHCLFCQLSLDIQMHDTDRPSSSSCRRPCVIIA